MNVRLSVMVFVLASVPAAAMAYPLVTPRSVAMGDNTVVSGRAHIWDGALGTYVDLERPGPGLHIAGFIRFGDQGAFPSIGALEGRRLQVAGVVDREGLITLTDPGQINLAD